VIREELARLKIIEEGLSCVVFDMDSTPKNTPFYLKYTNNTISLETYINKVVPLMLLCLEAIVEIGNEYSEEAAIKIMGKEVEFSSIPNKVGDLILLLENRGKESSLITIEFRTNDTISILKCSSINFI
jgi:hypothetical protein